MAQRKAAREPVAVIDIGSNSGRVIVYRHETGGRLQILAGSTTPVVPMIRAIRVGIATGGRMMTTTSVQHWLLVWPSEPQSLLSRTIRNRRMFLAISITTRKAFTTSPVPAAIW